MNIFKNAAAVIILYLVSGAVLGIGFSGCGQLSVRPDEHNNYVEHKIMHCRPSGDYNVPDLKYSIDDPETMVMKMAGGMERPTGIQFRDINTGVVKKLFFGGNTYRKYQCELMGDLQY